MPSSAAIKHQSIPQVTRNSASAIGALGALASALCGLSACNGCGSDKPYTPFGLASASAGVAPAPNGAAPSEASPTAPAASAGFAARKAELVPGAPRVWQTAGLSLTAPEARGFAQVLPADFDGDQKTDAVAWTVSDPNAKDAAPGELWYFPNGGAPRKLAALPGFVPSGPDCSLSVLLSQTGPHSATLDATATCKAALIARAPTRAIVVVAPSVERPILLTLRCAPAAPGETLNLAIDSSDQDQDGRDDVRVTVSVSGPTGSEPASADLAWLDRAAGASRAASEPGLSLTRLTGRLALHARTKRDPHGSERIGNALRLLSSLCAEGGVARVLDEDGAPFRCGDLGRTIDSLTQSEMQGALSQGDVLEAFAVLARDGWYFSKVSSGQRKALERDLLHAVPRFDADPPYLARALPSVPHGPHYSPLWFEADGALLIRGESGVTRVATDRSAEELLSADAGAPSWPLLVLSPSGGQLVGATHACDRSEILFDLARASRPTDPPLTTRLLAARPASCAGHGTGPEPSLAPLSFDENGLDALVSGSHVSTRMGAAPSAAALPTLGTPRSSDGRLLVTATALGVLLTGERKELWQTGKLHEHSAAAKFSDCVVANDARAVACLEAGRAMIFERPKPSPSAPQK